jgi:methyl-accepting chemotaxis protein
MVRCAIRFGTLVSKYQGDSPPVRTSTEARTLPMSLQDEITKAIGAHGVWKMRLRTAIDSGKADANAADVAKDNACAFGQWLYSAAIPASARASADYASVRQLHADFHRCAGKVLECVGHGDKAQADVLMAGDYTRISGDLTSAMMKWKAAGP